MKHDKLVRLVLAALFAAAACVATMLVHIPMPATNGYINLGDGVVLLGAFMLEPIYGAAAGGLGSMLADVLLGYAIYAPGTFVIKALSAMTAAHIARGARGERRGLIIGAALGETVMVLGYFAYEGLALGYGAAAAASIPGNAIQGAAGLIVGIIAYRALYAVPSIRKML